MLLGLKKFTMSIGFKCNNKFITASSATDNNLLYSIYN